MEQRVTKTVDISEKAREELIRLEVSHQDFLAEFASSINHRARANDAVRADLSRSKLLLFGDRGISGPHWLLSDNSVIINSHLVADYGPIMNHHAVADLTARSHDNMVADMAEIT